MKPQPKLRTKPRISITERIWRLDAIEPGADSSDVGAPAEPEPDSTPNPAHAECNQNPILSKLLKFVRRDQPIGADWQRAVWNWLIGDSRRFELALHRFAAVLDAAHRPADIEKELLLLVGQLLPATQSFVIPTNNNGCSSRRRSMAGPMSPGGVSTNREPAGLRSTHWVEDVPIRWRDVEYGRLRVVAACRNQPARRALWAQRLRTICSMAACALECLGRGAEGLVDPISGGLLERFADADRMLSVVESTCGCDRAKILHDATFLNAVLPFAVGQAQRHREPLSLLCVAIDRLHGIQELLGRAVADSLVRGVGEMVVSLIRSSDIVARLDDDRIVAVLPRSGDDGALKIGELICQKAAERHWTFSNQSGIKITVSVGAATFPNSAGDVLSLFDAADDALAQAEAQGRNRAIPAARIGLATPDQAAVASGSR